MRPSNGKSAKLQVMAATHETDSNDPCTALVHAKVSAIPSVLGRIVFLASCRNRATGEYHDSDLETQPAGLPCGRVKLDRALRDQHLSAFGDWLRLSIRRQMEEMQCYAADQALPAFLLVRQWIDERPFTEFIPTGAMQVERQLFIADMEAVLTVLSMRCL